MNMSELIPYANRLHFPEEMEKQFHNDYFEKSISTTRLALLLGIALVAVFSLLDFLAAPTALPDIWAIRFGVICPAFAIALVLTYRPIFMRGMQPLVSLAVLTGGLGIAAMSAVARPTEAAYTTYYAGLILVIMWGYTFIRLRFWYATLTGWIIVAGYQLVAIGYQHLLTAPMGLEVYINNNFFFVTANILGMCAAYFIERYARLDFLQRRVIEEEKAKSERFLQKEAAQALRESEARFRTLVEISTNGIIIIDPETRLTYVSPAFERMTGHTAGELVGQPFIPFIHPDDMPRMIATFARLVEQRESRVTVEYRAFRKDGVMRIFEGTGQLVPNGNVVGFIRDITERKQTETALRAIVEGTATATGNDFFYSLVQHLATALGVRHAFVAEVIGYPPVRVHTLAFWSSGSIMPNLEYALPGTPCENVVVGSVCYYAQNVQATFPADLDLVKLEAESYLGMPLIDSAGNVLGHVAVLDNQPMRDEARRQDILKIFAARAGAELERQQAERKLRASEVQFRSIIENASDIVTIINSGGIYEYASPSFERVLGWKSEDVIGQSIALLIHPDYLAGIVERVNQAFAQPGVAQQPYEFVARHQDGTWRRLEAVGQARSGGRLVVNARDITERRQLEERVRTSEEYFRSLIENASDGIAVTNHNGIITYVSPSYERIWGWTADELLGQPFLPLIHPDDVPLAEENLGKLMTIPGYIGSTEIRVKHKDGSWRVIEGKGKLLPNGSLVSNVRDVSDRRQAEEALRLAELRFRAVFEQPLIAVQIYTADGRVRQWNEAYNRLWGVTSDILAAAMHQHNVLLDEQLVALEVMPYVRQAFAGQAISVPVKQYTFPGDRVRWVQSFLYPVRDNLGAVHEVMVMHQDITEQKKAEEALHQLNEELEQRVAERTVQLEAAFTEHTRLAEILEATTDLVAFATLDGQTLYVNRAGLRMLGLADDLDVTTLNFADFYPPDVIELFNSVGFPTALRDVTWSSEVTLKHRAGHLIPVSIVGILHRLPDGTPSHLSAIVRDISERKRAEEDLQAALTESRRLATIIEAMPDYVGIADLQGWSVYVNKAGRRLVGKPEKDETPWNVVNCYPHEEMPHLQGMFDAMQRGGTWTGETRLRYIDGDIIPIEQTIFPLHDTSGNIESYAAVIRDISERKQAEAALHQAKEAAEAASRAKSTFLANMSHEIRTPMNAVIGMTGLLLNTPLNDKQRDFVETIRNSGDALLTIINDILDFSKIEAGKMDLVNRPFDLRACIESVLDLLAPKAAEKGLDLAYFMDAGVPAGISGDNTRLRQILVNLVGNAIKFTEQGEVVVSVSGIKSLVSTEKSNAMSDVEIADKFWELQFTVRDTGIGTPPDKLACLFHSFSQIDPSSTRHYGGTGLGLAISKRLVELMGGTMRAESEGSGKGTVFHFTMMAKDTPVPVRHHLSNPRPELSGKHVLIVDDNSTNRRILSLQLQNWGMLAREAGTPAEALEMLGRGETFSLALLDMNMPEMDGATLATEICRLHSPNHFPLVMLTSLGYQAHPELEALACYAAHLTKPVKPSQFYDTLVTIFASDATTKQLAMSPVRLTETDTLRALNYDLPISNPKSPNLLSSKYPLRILVAEDVTVNQKFALLALEEMGYRADVAANGLETLSAVLRQPYDVILMDVQMPEMDGLEATRRIHAIWSNQDQTESPRPGQNGQNLSHLILDGLPSPRPPYIIAMTANALQGDREICLEAGMDDYISKPVYLEELRTALERAGRNRRAATRPLRKAAREKSSPRRLDSSASLPDINQATLDKLLKRSTGPELIDRYLDEAQEMLNSLKSAVSRGDAQAIREAAHSLKGSSSYVGINRVFALSFELEQQGRQGTVSHAAITLAQLEEEFERAHQMLSKLTNGSVLSEKMTPG